MVHSILISEMKDTKSHVSRALAKVPNKKNFELLLNCHFELNFNNFPKKKKGKITNYYYNILTIGINIIESYIDTISDLGFTIILYLYPLYNFLKGDY